MTDVPGRIATFYSYKGGTGRSMALANIAWILAACGRRVLTIDWDLEAPGLHRYFRPFLVDPDLFETDGLIDAFWSYAASAITNSPSRKEQTSQDRNADVAALFEDATRRLDAKFETGGYIDFIGAGRQGATYSERVNTFDWKRFYELGGARFLMDSKATLRSQYDWIFIDSRTGVSDTSGICTVQMPDMVVACFTLNRQSIDGVTAILRSIRAFRSVSVDGSAIEFFPVATRIENAEQGRLEIARAYSRRLLAQFLPKAMISQTREYWDKMEIAYRPAYAFEEVLAAFGDATGAAGAADTMLSQVEAMAQRIASDDSLRMPEILETDRAAVLAKYAFDDRTAPVDSPRSRANEDAAETASFLRGVLAKEQLWRSSGYQWTQLLSRRELDLLTNEDRMGFGRTMTYFVAQSERAQGLFQYVDKAFIFSLLFAFAVVALFVPLTLAAPSLFNFGNDPLIKTILGEALFFGSWAGAIGVQGIIIANVGSVPYGVPLITVWKFIMLGPLKRTIRDFDPNEKTHLGKGG